MIKNIAKTVLILIISFLIFSFPVHAATGFSLGPGAFVDPSSGTWEEQKQYWPLVTINVADNGNLAGQARKNITTGPNDGGYVSVTTYDVKLKGQYDFDTGVFSGTFTVIREWDSQQKMKTDAYVSKYHQVGESQFTGKFVGQAKGETPVSGSTLTAQTALNLQP